MSMISNEAPRGPFSRTVGPFIAAGWSNDALLPAMPRTKRPGRHIRKGWVGMTGNGLLLEGLTAAETPTTWDEMQDWPTDGVCVLGRDYPGLDTDSESETVLNLVRMAVPGLQHERGREGSNRVLFPFRCDEPFKPWRPIEFHMPQDPPGSEPHKIELNAWGKQWVAAGEHPKGGRYVWRDQAGECAPPRHDELPPLTRDEADEFRVRLVMRLRAAGATFLNNSDEEEATYRGSGTRVQTDDLDPTLPVELVERILAAIPDNRETVGGWDEAIPLLASMRYVLGREGAALPEFVEAWTCAFEDSGPEWIEGRWSSFDGGVEAREGTFLKWVREHAPPELYEEAQGHVDTTRTLAAFGAIEEDDEDEGDQAGHPLTAREQAVNRMIYYQTRKLWVDTATGMFMETSAFNDHQVGRAVTAEDLELRKRGSNGEMKAVGAHKLLVDHAQVVDAITYAYGEPQVFTAAIDGPRLSYFNRCRPSRLKALGRAVTDDDVRPFLDHVEMLLPEDGSAGVLLDWMAYVVQHEKDKPTWAPVLVGPQGVGKDTALKPLKEAVGPHNFREVRPDDFVQRFTPFLESRVVVVQELDHSERRNAYERFKAPISGTAGGLLTIELKGQDPYRIIDRACFVILTNHSNALALSQDDRRFYVAQTTDTKPPREHFDLLHAWFDAGGHRKVLTWLQGRDLSGFMPHQPPAPTAAKLRMIKQARSEPEQWICDQVESGRWAQRTILSAKGVLEAAREAVKPQRGVSNATPGSALTAAGWKRFPREMKVTFADGRRPTLQLWLRDASVLEPRQGESQKVVEKRILDTFRQEEDGGDDVIETASRGHENGDDDAV